MALFDPAERAELVDLIAQAVIERIEERERVNRLADLVVQRVLSLQSEETSSDKTADKPTKRQD